MINKLKKAFFFTLMMVLGAAASWAQGDDITKKALELPPFHSISLNSSYTVYIKQTNKQEVRVEALTEIFNASEFKVENGVLHINLEKKKSTGKSIWEKIDDIKITNTMKVFVSVKDFKSLMVNGNGKIVAENSLSADLITLAVNGAGSMDLDIKGKEVNTLVSGSGNIKLKGYATVNNINVSGSGSVNSFNTELEQLKVNVYGSGSCEAKASESAILAVYGSGSISLKGNTKKVVQNSYGNGNITRAY